jgi:hypothetical protein
VLRRIDLRPPAASGEQQYHHQRAQFHGPRGSCLRILAHSLERGLLYG